MRQFTCTYMNQPGVLRFPGHGQFSWEPAAAGASEAGASKPTAISHPLSSVTSVWPAKVIANKPKSIALRVSIKPPASHAFYDLHTFASEAQRDEARALLSAGAAAAAPSAAPPASAAAAARSSSPLPPTYSPTPSAITTTTTTTTPTVLPPPRQRDPVALASTYPVASRDVVATRIKLLQKDGKLRALHQKLVQGKIVSEEDFWVGKEALVSEQFALDRQAQALPNTSLLDPTQDKVELAAKRTSASPPPVAGAGGGAGAVEDVVLTKDVIERIYLEHPDVKHKHDQLVPHSVTEAQFWTSYLHSRHVLGTRRNVDFAEMRRAGGGGGSGNAASAAAQRKKKSLEQKEWESRAEDMFGSVDLHRLEFRRELERDFPARMQHIDPDVDLTKTLDDCIATSALAGMPHTGYGIVRRENDWFVNKSALELARSLAANKKTKDVEKTKEKLDEITAAVREDPLLTTLNQRAVALSQQQQQQDKGEDDASQELRRKRLKADHDAELHMDRDLDLAAATGSSNTAPPLPASVARAVLAAAAAPATTTTDAASQVPAPSAMPRAFSLAFAFPTAEDHFTFPHENAHLQQQWLANGAGGGFDFAAQLPSELQDAFITEIKAVDEYCRHFWATPSASPKRCLIVAKMREVSQRIQGPVREAIRSSAPLGAFLTKLPLAQLSRAMEEHAVECKQCL